jgi:hypothetical protein
MCIHVCVYAAAVVVVVVFSYLVPEERHVEAFVHPVQVQVEVQLHQGAFGVNLRSKWQ